MTTPSPAAHGILGRMPQQRLLRQRMRQPSTFTPDGTVRAMKIHDLRLVLCFIGSDFTGWPSQPNSRKLKSQRAAQVALVAIEASKPTPVVVWRHNHSGRLLAIGPFLEAGASSVG